MKYLLAVVICFSFFSCSIKPCKIEDRSVSAQNQKELQTMKDNSQIKVKVYKPDGTLQCNQGVKIPLEKMQSELKNIKVYSFENKHDGLMRIQVCGNPTGYCNVFEIDSDQLAEAESLGFKKWVRE